jgi:CHASE2 domain-containing sensor protein
MLWRKRKRSFLATFRTAVPAIILAIAGAYVLSRLGTLHGLEHVALNAEMAASHRSSNICLVEITDSDYEDIFGGRSPLQPDKLHDLINAVAMGKPAMIGVDIDTSHPQFKALIPEANWPPVVWERDIANNRDTTKAEIEPLDVLGGQNPLINKSSGVPALLDDPEDKVTRLYTRCVRTRAGLEPTLVSAVVSAYRSQAALEPCRGTGPTDVGLEPLFIKYSLGEAAVCHKDAAQMLGIMKTYQDGGQSQLLAEFSNKAVLIGGTYGDSDRHFTPIGTLPGVEVLANAIQTELDGEGIQAHSRWLLFVIEFAASTFIVLFFHLFALSPGRALAWGLPLTVVGSVLLSILSFHTFSRFVTFAPTLFAVLVFETYEHVRHEAILGSVRSEHGRQRSDH